MRRSEHGGAGGDPAGGGSPAGNRAWEDWIERGVGLASLPGSCEGHRYMAVVRFFSCEGPHVVVRFFLVTCDGIVTGVVGGERKNPAKINRGYYSPTQTLGVEMIILEGIEDNDDTMQIDAT